MKSHTERLLWKHPKAWQLARLGSPALILKLKNEIADFFPFLFHFVQGKPFLQTLHGNSIACNWVLPKKEKRRSQWGNGWQKQQWDSQENRQMLCRVPLQLYAQNDYISMWEPPLLPTINPSTRFCPTLLCSSAVADMIKVILLAGFAHAMTWNYWLHLNEFFKILNTVNDNKQRQAHLKTCTSNTAQKNPLVLKSGTI